MSTEQAKHPIQPETGSSPNPPIPPEVTDWLEIISQANTQASKGGPVPPWLQPPPPAELDSLGLA